MASARARTTPQRAAFAGVLATAVFLATAELASRVVARAGSPLLSVGETVIARTPAGLREGVIFAVGTNDKPLLVAVLVLVCLALGASAGLVARRSWPIAGTVVAFLVVVLSVVWHNQSRVALAPVVLVTAIAAGCAWASLRALLQDLPGPQRLAAGDVEREDGAQPTNARWAERDLASIDRRDFLVRAAAVAVVAGTAAIASRVVDLSRTVTQVRGRIQLPTPARAAPSVPPGAAFNPPGATPLVTANADFYRVDTALETPQVDSRSWMLTINGLVDRQLQLSYDDLLALPQTEAWITVGCVGNPVGGSLIGTASWQGVLLADLLRRAGPAPGAAQVVGTSVDGYTGAFPLDVALDGRNALVALAMNGEPLPVEHGFPARLVVPGLYGYESAVKWLDSVTLQPARYQAFWVSRGYAAYAPFRTSSRIDSPQADAVLATGQVEVTGMAWAPHRGVGGVEVSVDGSPFQTAELAPASLGPDVWRPWRWPWAAVPGRHTLTVRATDGEGRPQDESARSVLPDGATGLHSVTVTVR